MEEPLTPVSALHDTPMTPPSQSSSDHSGLGGMLFGIISSFKRLLSSNNPGGASTNGTLPTTEQPLLHAPTGSSSLSGRKRSHQDMNGRGRYESVISPVENAEGTRRFQVTEHNTAKRPLHSTPTKPPPRVAPKTGPKPKPDTLYVRVPRYQQSIESISKYKNKVDERRDGKEAHIKQDLEAIKRDLQQKAEAKKARHPERSFLDSPSDEVLSRIPTHVARKINPGAQVIKIGRNPVSNGDLTRVLTEEGEGDAWLNDEAVNAFFTALTGAANDKWRDKDQAPPAFHAFSNMWWINMSDPGGGYDRVKGWAKRAKIPGPKLLKLQIIFFPCCTGTHWFLAAAFPQSKRVRIYDSIGNRRVEVQDAIRTYLQQEIGNDGFDARRWDFGVGKSSHQQNGSDCGVFTCLNGLALLYRREPRTLVPPQLRPNGRVLLAAMLVNGGFQGEFDLESLEEGLFSPYRA
jgi:sentrin-specific protease 1